MAKRKSGQPASGDRHSKRWTISLPLVYQALFEALKQRNRRPLTMEVCIALEAHLKEAGLWPPPEGTEEPED